VGIGEREDAAKLPTEKSEKINDAFPWGTQWPPPNNAGNYADTSFHEKFPGDSWLQGYTDGYVTTSPTGRFAANALGLYDMGGDVEQWCEDWFDTAQDKRVTRGIAWSKSSRTDLLSSHRNARPPAWRNNTIGWRCILEPAP
jgi:formylglycine-generating enzyme required for sulfatase activity